MSCEVKRVAKLSIDCDERGYQEWDEGEDIDLELKNGDFVFGELQDVTEDAIKIIGEEGELVTIKFDDIETYL